MLKKTKKINKKRLVTIIGLLLGGVIGYLYFTKSIKEIPSFRYTEISTKNNFTNKDLKSNYKKLFIYFSPSCEDCGGLIKYIRTAKDKFENTQILMVSTRPFKSLQQYVIDNDVKSIKNIIILHDSTRQFVREFHLGSLVALPTILMFDSNNTLIYNGDDKGFKDFMEGK